MLKSKIIKNVSDGASSTAAVTATAAANTEPEFLDAAGIQSRYGIKRSLAYSLLADGSIRGVSLRRRGQQRGKRLFDCASVREFLRSQMEGQAQ